MIDIEGPNNPSDKGGHKYVLTYICCLSHAVLLEPLTKLTAREVRRAVANCIFRSGTIPTLIRLVLC